MSIQQLSNKLIFIVSFFLLVFESKSNPVNISPRQVASVEENGDINVTCNVDLELYKWDLVVQMSVQPITVLRINRVSLGTCSKSPITPSNSQLTYGIICDRTNNAVTLQILNVSLADDNISISCILRRDDMKYKWVASTNICVKVPVESVHILNGGQAVFQENMEKELQCRTSASRPAANVTWYKILSGHQQYEIIQLNSTLISNCTKDGFVTTTSYLRYIGNLNDNGGILFCEATDGDVTVRSNNLTINIPYAPKSEQYSKESIEVPEGNEFTFKCYVNCHPKCWYEWRKNDSVFNEGVELKIRNLTKTDSGIYSCYATNTIVGPNFTRISELKILLLYKPNITDLQLKEDVKSSNLRLFCKVEGNPLPNITWKHKDERESLLIHERVSFSNFTLEKVNCVKRVYECVANNGIGSALQETSIPDKYCKHSEAMLEEMSIIPWIISALILSLIVTSVIMVVGFVFKKKHSKPKGETEEVEMQNVETDENNPDGFEGGYRENLLYGSFGNFPAASTHSTCNDSNTHQIPGKQKDYTVTNRGDALQPEAVGNIAENENISFTIDSESKDDIMHRKICDAGSNQNPEEDFHCNSGSDSNSNNILYQSSDDLQNYANDSNASVPNLFHESSDSSYNDNILYQSADEFRTRDNAQCLFPQTLKKTEYSTRKMSQTVLPTRKNKTERPSKQEAIKPKIDRLSELADLVDDNSVFEDATGDVPTRSIPTA